MTIKIDGMELVIQVYMITEDGTTMRLELNKSDLSDLTDEALTKLRAFAPDVLGDTTSRMMTREEIEAYKEANQNPDAYDIDLVLDDDAEAA